MNNEQLIQNNEQLIQNFFLIWVKSLITKGKMYEIPIILFCLIRSIVVRLLKNKPSPQKKQPQQSQTDNKLNQQSSEMKNIIHQSPEKNELNELKNRKKQIQQTIQQFNNPSTFAKYSKMQRQLSKLNNKIPQIQQIVNRQIKLLQAQTSTNKQTQKEQKKQTLLDLRKKQVQNIHGQIANKDLLIKAFLNLSLIIACSYVESLQVSLCAGYPLYGFCNQQGRINGGWIFVISSVLFSY